MSQKKHLHTLSELSAHPIARNVEWSELIPALASIGLLHEEKNGNYHFSRNGHTLAFEHSHRKVLETEEILKLRRFLQLSAKSETDSDDTADGVIVAIDYHKAFICHDPGNASESHVNLHANLSSGRILHKTARTAPFNDSNPPEDAEYLESVIKEILPSERIVILSHGTGSSRASDHLLEVIQKDYSELAHRIVATKNCDLEAMTEPQIVEVGIELLHAKSPIAVTI